jgi:acyl-CoA thioesterase I
VFTQLHIKRPEQNGSHHTGSIWSDSIWSFRHIVMSALICNCVTIAVMLGMARTNVWAADAPATIRIAAFGDSLSAGFQLPPDQSFPAQLDRTLKAKGHNVEVFNAAVSGDTTAAGLDRLAWAVPEETEAVILELGANDALRGLAPKAAHANLDTIIAKLKAQKAEILLAGMKAPRNLGAPYVEAFDAIFPDLAAKHGLLLHPFFVETIALKPEFNLADGMHPNPKGVAAIVADILPKVEELIERVKARRATRAKG